MRTALARPLPNKGLQMPSARFDLSTTGSVWHHAV